MSPTPPQETLQESFLQSRRELRFMLLAWVLFGTWVVGCSALTAYQVPSVDEPATWWGMPRWVALSVALPWLVADVVILAFAARGMKDTDLEGGANRE